MPDSLLGGIVINEILVDPNGALNFDTDGNGTAAAVDEYVELYNTSGSAIDISGLELWDAGIGHWFTFPPGTILAAGGHAMVMSGLQAGGSLPTGDPDDLFFEAGRATALINNGGDNVTLYDPGNDEFVQATYNGDSLDDPTLGAGGYSGFSATATRNGLGEDFGNDTDGQSLQRTGDGSDTFGSEDATPGTTNICFADGTHVLTPDGPRRVETLAVGDLVLNADNTAVPLRWIFAKTWSADQMRARQNLAPICISQGALGVNLPSKYLRISQQHRILIEGPIARRMFGSDEVLVPAKALLSLAGVYIDEPSTPVSYYHLMLDQHDILISEGLRSESLYLGKQALSSIPHAALNEALMLLGLSKESLTQNRYPPARPIAQMKQARRLIARHRRNDKPLTPDGKVYHIQKAAP
ncbi:Hint domain-containing protein [Planktotalea sp.]|uniref:Hint domain-containing protein n=1 Tax=Planktotalea sp. TaxID=2029877 RepID=UPI003D6B77A6